MAVDGIIVLSGPPCSGKSTVGRLLGAGGDLAVVHVDDVFDRRFPGSDRNADDRLQAYAEAHREAVRIARRGHAVVLECTYARIGQRASLVTALAGASLAVRIVELHVSPDEAVRRSRDRDQQTDLDDTGVRERAANFPYSDLALRIDASRGTPADHVGRVLAWLASEPPVVDPVAWRDAGRD